MFRADGLKIYPTLVIRGTGNLKSWTLILFTCLHIYLYVNDYQWCILRLLRYIKIIVLACNVYFS